MQVLGVIAMCVFIYSRYRLMSFYGTIMKAVLQSCPKFVLFLIPLAHHDMYSFSLCLSVYLRFTLYALDSRGSRSEASYVTVRTSCPIVDDSRAEGTPPLSVSISLPPLHLNPSEKIVSSHLLLA